MRHLLILLSLVAGGFNAMSQGSFGITNDTGEVLSSIIWVHGEVQEDILASGSNLSIKGDVYTLRGDAYTGFAAGDLLAFITSGGAEYDISTTVGVPSGVYVVPFSVATINGEFSSLAQFEPYLVPVPEPNTNVFFLMGLTLLVLSNRCRWGRWLPSLGLSAAQPCLSRFATFAGR